MNDQKFDKLWSDEKRGHFRAAAAELVDAIRQHSEELTEMAGPSVEGSTENEGRLTRAAIAYADAQFNYTGTLPPLGLIEIETDEDRDADDDENEQPATRISVLRRADYRVADVEVVIDAGRRAYRASWPDDDEDDAQRDVNHLGRAVYQIEHAGGLQSLDETRGLEPAGATTWVLETAELLGDRDSDDWPDDPFAVGPDATERLLHRLDEVDG